jgi:predicted unusual protein kinase regulating ubiquinone biosynthesis (AarF/ABC1/UbiB family)
MDNEYEERTKNKKRNKEYRKIKKTIVIESGKNVKRRMQKISKQESNLIFHQNIADKLSKILSELRGGATKFGQFLAIYQAALPEEYSNIYSKALSNISDNIPPISQRVIKKVLEKNLGFDFDSKIINFDYNPIAAASIGQVHKAVWHDGTLVAVKIQYPGIKEAIVSDYENFLKIGRLLNILLPNLEYKNLLLELKESILQELDYLKEFENQKIFYDYYSKNDENIIVPRPIAVYNNILITEYIEGEKFINFIESGKQRDKNKVALTLAKLHITSPENLKILHSDPNLGNFLVSKDKKLVLLDFGSCKDLPEGMPKPLIEMINVAMKKDSKKLLDLFITNDFIDYNVVDDKLLFDFLFPLIAPLSSNYFNYNLDWLRRENNRIGDFKNPVSKIGLKLRLPVEYLLIHRVTMGCTVIYSMLNASGNFKKIVIDTYFIK